MDNSSQNNSDNQNSAGISGFGAVQDNSTSQTPSGLPPVVVPEAPILPTTPPVPAVSTPPSEGNPDNTIGQNGQKFQTSSIQTQPSAGNTEPVAEAPASKPDTPNTVPEAQTGLESKQNFTKQSIVGGIEESKPKSKPIFSLPKIGPSAKTPDQSTGQDNAATVVPPAYNEITAPAVQGKFALVAIIIGVILLIVAGSGYYYLASMSRKADELAEETQPMVEQPTTPEIVEDSTIDTDSYIVRFTQIEANPSVEPSDLKEQMQSLDLQNIDLELVMQAKEVEQEQPVTPESIPQIQQ